MSMARSLHPCMKNIFIFIISCVLFLEAGCQSVKPTWGFSLDANERKALDAFKMKAGAGRDVEFVSIVCVLDRLSASDQICRTLSRDMLDQFRQEATFARSSKGVELLREYLRAFDKTHLLTSAQIKVLIGNPDVVTTGVITSYRYFLTPDGNMWTDLEFIDDVFVSVSCVQFRIQM